MRLVWRLQTGRHALLLPTGERFGRSWWSGRTMPQLRPYTAWGVVVGWLRNIWASEAKSQDCVRAAGYVQYGCVAADV